MASGAPKRAAPSGHVILKAVKSHYPISVPTDIRAANRYEAVPRANRNRAPARHTRL
jgi:hypothetical protein